MKVTNALWDGIPCTCHELRGGMGSETYIYVADGKIVGAEVIDGEWTQLDADDATEAYGHLLDELMKED